MPSFFAFAFQHLEAMFGRDVVVPHEVLHQGKLVFVSCFHLWSADGGD